MIIGFVGLIGSGKDTCADILVSEGGFKRVSFATTLKDAVSAVFGWDREALEGNTEESRAWREEVDEWWAEKLGMPKLTPRWVLQYWGTDVLRKGFHDDIWIASLESKLLQMKQDAVISDVRFPNEIESIKNAGGKIIWVKRGPLPLWYDHAIEANQGDILGINALKTLKVHSSEWAWVGTEFDDEITNDGTLEDLYKQVENTLKVTVSD